MRAMVPLLIVAGACGSGDASGRDAGSERATPLVEAVASHTAASAEARSGESSTPNAPAPSAWPFDFPVPPGGTHVPPVERRTLRVHSAIYARPRIEVEASLMAELERTGWSHSAPVDAFDGRRWVCTRDNHEVVVSLVPDGSSTRFMLFQTTRGIGEAP